MSSTGLCQPLLPDLGCYPEGCRIFRSLSGRSGSGLWSLKELLSGPSLPSASYSSWETKYWWCSFCITRLPCTMDWNFSEFKSPNNPLSLYITFAGLCGCWPRPQLMWKRCDNHQKSALLPSSVLSLWQVGQWLGLIQVREIQSLKTWKLLVLIPIQTLQVPGEAGRKPPCTLLFYSSLWWVGWWTSQRSPSTPSSGDANFLRDALIGTAQNCLTWVAHDPGKFSYGNNFIVLDKLL